MRFFSVRRVAAGAGVAAGLVLLSSVFPLRAQESRSPQGLLVTQVAERVHMISGDGSNIAVQSGPDGVVLVDSGAGRRSTEVLAAVKALASEPIRYVINTSADAQAVGGNAVIAAAGDGLGAAGGGAAAAFGGVRTGAARLGHENVLLRMSMPAAGRPAFPEPAWPTEGYVDAKNLYLNGEAIQLLHMPAAATDADTVVFFRRSDVIVTGHIVDTTRFPMIDVAAGGSVQGEIAALNKLIELAIPPTPLVWQEGGTRVIPARGHVLEQADLVEYRDMVTIVRDVVQDMIKKGMTLDQIKRAEPTKGYTKRYGSQPGTIETFVEAVHASLTQGGAR